MWKNCAHVSAHVSARSKIAAQPRECDITESKGGRRGRGRRGRTEREDGTLMLLIVVFESVGFMSRYMALNGTITKKKCGKGSLLPNQEATDGMLRTSF